jgi:hypothetical protein
LLQAKRDQIRAAQSYVDILHEYWTLRSQAEQLGAGRLPQSFWSDTPVAMPTTPAVESSGGAH